MDQLLGSSRGWFCDAEAGERTTLSPRPSDRQRSANRCAVVQGKDTQSLRCSRGRLHAAAVGREPICPFRPSDRGMPRVVYRVSPADASCQGMRVSAIIAVELLIHNLDTKTLWHQQLARKVMQRFCTFIVLRCEHCMYICIAPFQLDSQVRRG